jgi:hypothetical protein
VLAQEFDHIFFQEGKTIQQAEVGQVRTALKVSISIFLGFLFLILSKQQPHDWQL